MDQLQPGQMLGPYRIMSQIGQGGMATVYKAYQPSMDRNVAVKILPGKLAESEEFVQRFQQEARIIARLEHAHILPVFDYGESDGITYFVMRYLDAGTLKDKMVNGRPLPLHEIDRLFTQLANALSYAHSRGVVHRDLKPANALIDSRGDLFLTDFGIAKILESASPRLTQTDAIMGTPDYISPEQALGKQVDQRSDIYSLGIILYEMVTGRVPYTADTPLAVILKHVSDPLPLPSSIKSDLPDVIERVILKALAKNPRDRFSNMDEFLSAWKRALDETTSSQRASQTTVRPEVPFAQPFNTPQDLRGSTQGKPALAPKAPSRPWNRASWVVGCLIGACVLFSGAGALAFMFNGNAFPFLNTTPITPTSSVPTLTPTVPIPTEPPAPTSATNVLFRDDFSDDSIWTTVTDSYNSTAYDNNALRMKLFRKNRLIAVTPNKIEVRQNIHAEVTAYNNDGETTTTFGLICNLNETTFSYYYAVISPDGDYVIAKKTAADQHVFLTNNGQWASSNLVRKNAASYRLGLDCGYGTLAFYVDGQLIDSASDSSYSNGTVGLIIGSGENVSSADVTFDDFILTSLE